MPVAQAQINKDACDRIALPNEMLAKIIEAITGAMDAERIYVFGSYARGDQGSESDIDLYAIVPSGTKQELIVEEIEARRALMRLHMPIDLLVATRDAFDLWAESFWTVEAAVKQEGVLIYG